MFGAAFRAVILFVHLPAAWSGLATCTTSDPAAKAVVCAMDHALVGLGDGSKIDYDTYLRAMKPYFSDNFVYTPAYGIPETVGFKDWYDGEWSIWFKSFPDAVFNQMLFLGGSTNASSMTYSVGVFEQPLGPVQSNQVRTDARITDFYIISGRKITHNWMMIDMLDLLRQSGKTPLALSALPQGRDYPPMAMEGLPAPLSPYVVNADTTSSKRVVEKVLDSEWRGMSDTMDLWSESMRWYGPVPFGFASGKAEYKKYFLEPLHSAFAHRDLALNVLTCEGKFCAAHGTFSGIHVGTWLGQEPSHKLLQLDFGMHWHVVDSTIVESWAIFDIPKMFLALGVDLLSGTDDEKRSDDVIVFA